jgi:hypothetical protein
MAAYNLWKALGQIFFFFFFFFETVSLNLQAGLNLPSAGIIRMYHHTQQVLGVYFGEKIGGSYSRAVGEYSKPTLSDQRRVPPL